MYLLQKVVHVSTALGTFACKRKPLTVYLGLMVQFLQIGTRASSLTLSFNHVNLLFKHCSTHLFMLWQTKCKKAYKPEIEDPRILLK